MLLPRLNPLIISAIHPKQKGASVTGRVSDPAPGACFITKFISLAQVVPWPI